MAGLENRASRKIHRGSNPLSSAISPRSSMDKTKASGALVAGSTPAEDAYEI